MSKMSFARSDAILLFLQKSQGKVSTMRISSFQTYDYFNFLRCVLFPSQFIFGTLD